MLILTSNEQAAAMKNDNELTVEECAYKIAGQLASCTTGALYGRKLDKEFEKEYALILSKIEYINMNVGFKAQYDQPMPRVIDGECERVIPDEPKMLCSE